MGIETVLLTIRVAACAVIFLLLATYRPRAARWKLGVSLLASCLAGTCFAGMVASVMFWQEELRAWYLPWLTVLTVLLAMRVGKARGNMAVVIHWKRHRT